MNDVYSLKVRHRPGNSWRRFVGLGMLLVAIAALGLALLFLEGGSLLGLIPAIPGGLLAWGGVELLRSVDRSGQLFCAAQLVDDLLRIDGHDFHLNEDFTVVLGSSRGVVIATFIQRAEKRCVAWQYYGGLARATDSDERALRRLRSAWDFEGKLRELQFAAPGAYESFGGMLLKAIERNAQHDRLEVLRHVLRTAPVFRPDPDHHELVDIPDGAPGRSVPYRGGATTPADGQRFLDDFRKDACELVPDVHVGAEYVAVRRAGVTTLIPIGRFTAEADVCSLELAGEDARRVVEMPDPASAETIADLLRRHGP